MERDELNKRVQELKDEDEARKLYKTMRNYELMKEGQKSGWIKFYNSVFGWLFIRIPMIFFTCGLWLLFVEFPLWVIKKNNKKTLKDYGKL